MKLTQEALKIDVEKTTKIIEQFIRDTMKELNREGICVPISGGLDSSTACCLCVRAVGADKVVGLMINDKEGSALEANSFGNLLVNHLKIKKEYIDLTPALEGMGAYKYLTQENMSKLSQMGNWHEEFPKNDLMRKVFCYAMVRHRLRLVEALRYAEEHNLLEVGGAHKTENYLGLFGKFSVDSCADVMPLLRLFRTQILQIAEYIGLPKEITGRSPNPDISKEITDKYKFFLDMDVNVLDLILFGFEQGMKDDEISKETGESEAKVKKVRELVEKSRHMRQGVLYPTFDFAQVYL